MKKWMKVLAVVLCLCFLQTPVMEGVTSVTEVQAAVKKGLKKEKGKYYYYVRGRKVKNTWKSVKIKNKKTHNAIAKLGIVLISAKYCLDNIPNIVINLLLLHTAVAYDSITKHIYNPLPTKSRIILFSFSNALYFFKYPIIIYTIKNQIESHK